MRNLCLLDGSSFGNIPTMVALTTKLRAADGKPCSPLLLASPLNAQMYVSFAGGTNPNDPLILTIDAPVTYVVITATQNLPQYGGTEAPIFVINGANYGPIGMMTGNVTFTLTSGGVSTTYPIQFAFGDTLNPNVPDGIGLNGPSESLAIGDVLTLNPGTLTALNGTPFPTRPSNGSYPTYLVDGYSRVLSASGVSVVPEPSTGVCFGMALSLLLASLLRTRRPIIAAGV